MGGQQYVKGKVSVTSTPMVSTTAQHPEGYTQAEDSPGLWWGESVEREEYNLYPAWTESGGHSISTHVVELSPAGAAAMAADLARWAAQTGE